MKENLNFLKWIRENAYEIHEGWAVDGKFYTDRQLVTKYTKTLKTKEK
jgi:uncharacterized NAD(P)/FAD-binding protein YdhS